MFRVELRLLAAIAVETVVIGLAAHGADRLLGPPRLPQLRPVMDIISILPFVVPPVALVVGLSGAFQVMPWLLSDAR